MFNWEEAFEKLANEQRGKPESLMLIDNNPGLKWASGLYTWCLEHTGDLINRAAKTENTGGGVGWGMGAVGEKVDKLYKQAHHSYGFEKDIFEQIERNRKFYIEKGEINESLSLEECIDQVKKAGQIYANAYKKLVPLTKLQKWGKLAAIALGEMDWKFYRTILYNMKTTVDLPDEEYKRKYLTLLPEYQSLNESHQNMWIINQLEEAFDYMTDVIIEDTMFSPNEGHIVLSVYHALNEKNKNALISLSPKTMKHVALLIHKQMDGNIF